MAKKKKSPKDDRRFVARNKRARHDYEILETFEAGLELRGSEVKTLRGGKGTIAEAHIRLVDGEAWLLNANVPEYPQASYNNHEPSRKRRLLLKKTELRRLQRASTEKGLAIVPLALYFKGSWIKLELALGRGKKLFDKRETLKQKQTKRETDRMLKNY
ncbi:MAG: SsrA-binding protein SmpB [Myxococcota bacterium]|nr:SsrA-binding protein SmpB [Myxococcota bacterium]